MGTTSESGDHYSSQLASRPDRFVSELFASAVENNWRDAEEFLDHFAVESILEALAGEEELRVRLLVETTGTHEKIAAKKSPMSAAEDLRLALDEGTTTPDAVLALFDADDWVRILGARALWDFLCDDKFWNTDAKDKNAFTEALERVTETIHRAIQHKVISETAVVDAVGFERLVGGLEEAQVRELLVSALEAGKDGEVFSAEALLDVFPLERILERVSLSFAWSEIVVQHVQQPLELGEGSAAPRRNARAEADRNNRARSKPPPTDEQPKSKRAARRAAAPAEEPEPSPARPAPARELPRPREAETRPLTPPASNRRRSSQPPPAAQTQSAPPPPLPRAPSNPPPPAARQQHSMPPPPSARAAARPAPPPRQSSGPPPLPGSSAPPPPNDPMLAQAVSRLSRIDRLPSRHSEFPAAVLHAIESMYGELATVSDAQEQLNVIKDAFPNDLWRARAMLALLELLNPNAISSPSIAHESADALSIRLLTEERQLSRNAAQARNGRSGTH